MIVGIEGLFFSTATTQWQAKKKKRKQKTPQSQMLWYLSLDLSQLGERCLKDFGVGELPSRNISSGALASVSEHY